MKNKREKFLFGFLITGIVCCLFIICVGLCKEKEHIHNYDDWLYSSNPTCTASGLRERFCRCGHRQESETAALGHDLVTVDGKPAGCTDGGYAAYVRCSRCDYSTYAETEALGHSFGDWQQTTNATCTEYGEETRYCTRGCGFSQTRQTEVLAHSMSGWTTELTASCTTEGLEIRRCSVCLTVETRVVAETGHDFGDWVTVAAPDCVTDGLEKRICTRDETHVETRRTDKTGHTPSGWIIEKRADCNEDGLEVILCSVCDLRLETRVVKASGHDFGEWRMISLPTCSAFGTEKRICSHNEAHFETRLIDKTAHSPSDWITDRLPDCETEGERRKECTVCGETLERESTAATAHDFINRYDEATHFAVCLKCNAVRDSAAHVWGDNACTVCEYDAGGIKGLEWKLGADGAYYILNGLGSVSSTVFDIPETHNGIKVSALGGSAFNGFTGESITIPRFITDIGFGAFAGCKNLRELKLPYVGNNGAVPSDFGYFFGSDNAEDNAAFVPESLKTVEIFGCTRLAEGAFKNCAYLTEIILPAELEALGAESFYGCTFLSAVSLPEGLKSVGSAAFWACTSLKELVVPASVEEIGAYAFYGTAEDIRIVFSDTKGWALYDGETRVSDIPEDYLSEEGVKAFAKYIWKREK